MNTEIKKILILVELANGKVHQVLASNLQKQAAIHLLRADDGSLKVTKEVLPLELEFKA
jgi:hypothetical protein